MSWNRNKSRLFFAAAAALLAADMAAAATLVVRSSGPAAKAYPAGRALSGNKVTLGPTDSVTILDARGTRTFKGPGSFDVTATASAAGAGTTLAALVSQPGERRARIGAVRSVGGAAPRSPNLWYVEADRSGTHCITDPVKVRLWRPNMTTEQSYVITGGSKAATVDWLKGQSERDWPTTLPITSGAEYRIAVAGQPSPAAVRFVVLPAKAGEPLDALAGRLISAKCTAQLDLLVDTASAPDNQPPAG